MIHNEGQLSGNCLVFGLSIFISSHTLNGLSKAKMRQRSFQTHMH